MRVKITRIIGSALFGSVLFIAAAELNQPAENAAPPEKSAVPGVKEKEAVEDHTKALAFNPKDGETYNSETFYNRGMAYEKTRKDSLAISSTPGRLTSTRTIKKHI